MSVNDLYYPWLRRLTQLRSGERITRLGNMGWLLVGIFKGKSVHLSNITWGTANSGLWRSYANRTEFK